MPTVLGHVAAGAALVALFQNESWPRRAYLVGAACAVAPDLDVIGFSLGVPYGSPFGHRGFSHSFLTAGLLGFLAMLLCFPRRLWTVQLASGLILATASHGLLDAATSGGLGVGFFEPFDHRRYFFAWRPIRVSPLMPSRLLSNRFWAVLANELRWIVLPSVALTAGMFLVRKWRPWAAGSRGAGESSGV